MEQRPTSEATSVAEGLFDWGVTKFVTPKLLGIAYPLAAVLLAVYCLGIFVVIANAGELGFLLGLIGVPLLFFVTLAYLRVMVEVVAVLFRIGHGVDGLASSRPDGRVFEAAPQAASPPASPTRTRAKPPPDSSTPTAEQVDPESMVLSYLRRNGPASTGRLSDDLPMRYQAMMSELEALTGTGQIFVGDDGLWNVK